jgi:hypothetical protein
MLEQSHKSLQAGCSCAAHAARGMACIFMPLSHDMVTVKCSPALTPSGPPICTTAQPHTFIVKINSKENECWRRGYNCTVSNLHLMAAQGDKIHIFGLVFHTAWQGLFLHSKVQQCPYQQQPCTPKRARCHDGYRKHACGQHESAGRMKDPRTKDPLLLGSGVLGSNTPFPDLA